MHADELGVQRVAAAGDESLRCVHRALDLGSDLLDTADMYGPFTNELLLGRVLKERRRERRVHEGGAAGG